MAYHDRVVSAGIIQPQFFAATDQPGPIIHLGVMLSDIRESPLTGRDGDITMIPSTVADIESMYMRFLKGTRTWIRSLRASPAR